MEGCSVGVLLALEQHCVGLHTVCEIREGQDGSDPSKSARDPCKVIICRDPGWVP